MKKYLKLTPEEWGIISLLYLEYFVQKFLWGIYFTYQKFSYWNFNRNLDERNRKLAEQTPLSKND